MRVNHVTLFIQLKDELDAAKKRFEDVTQSVGSFKTKLQVHLLSKHIIYFLNSPDEYNVMS